MGDGAQGVAGLRGERNSLRPLATHVAKEDRPPGFAHGGTGRRSRRRVGVLRVRWSRAGQLRGRWLGPPNLGLRPALVGTASIWGEDRADTPLPNAGTSGPTASGVAAEAIAPLVFDRALSTRRSEVERTINGLKGFRTVASRYDKRAFVFHGTVTVAAIRLWIRWADCVPRALALRTLGAMTATDPDGNPPSHGPRGHRPFTGSAATDGNGSQRLSHPPPIQRGSTCPGSHP